MDRHADDWSGLVAVITGAGSGIGAALARQAGGRGMRLVLADLSEERVQRVASALAATTTVLPVATDVADWAAMDRLAERAYRDMGPVRLLVNNAGIETTGPLWELSPERWQQMISVNVSGVFHGIRAFVPRMLAEGASAHVVNLSSVGGLTVGAFQGAYNASKFAVQALTECLAMELALGQAPVSVSVVNPGPVATRIFEDAVALEDTDDSPVRQTLRALLRDEGISPDEAAAAIFDGAMRGDFWIFTHPDMARDAIERRYRMLRDASPPDISRYQ
jgi:NAD(P)-dependent dehydrogenase (short-subunit alcohol dehydrogenase family)